MGSGPDLLLIHGAGGASHSWRRLVPHLTSQFRVILVDLPGQGFTVLGNHGRCGLDAMASDLLVLAQSQNWHPVAVIGHSAGAAIALRMAELTPLRGVVGINAALGEFDGLAGWLYPAMAKILAATPFLAQLFSRAFASPAQADNLIASTGSTLEPAGMAQYLTLLRKSDHVDATLAMMAQWRLAALLSRLPGQTAPCLLITSDLDRAVPPVISHQAAAQMNGAEVVDIPGFGHLVHEESGEIVATPILEFLARIGAVS